MELLEYYDENNEKIIGIAEREIIHENNLWHREVAIWVINDKNEILLQRRSSNKKQGANKLSTTAGHVDVNENVEVAALRELNEEVGLEVNFEDLVFVDIYKNVQEGNMCYKYTYLVRTDKKIDEFVMQEEEVSELMYVTIPELEERIRKSDSELSFVKKPYVKEILEKIKQAI